MSGKYIEVNGKAILCEDVLEWGAWYETADRKVARTEKGPFTVSTVFLGLDHSFGRDTAVLYETMVFGGELEGKIDRYHTRKEALKGHKKMCMRVFGEDKS